MIEVSVRVISSGPELAKRLQQFPKRISKNVLRRAVYAVAVVIRDEARQRAPVLKEATKQRTPGTLRRNIILKAIKELSTTTTQTFWVMVRSGKTKYANTPANRAKGRAGKLKPYDPTADAFYWWMVEFGTTKMRAQPFMRPAFDAKKDDALNAFIEKLNQGIEEELRNLV